jgi:hypothetical protein
VNISKLNTQRNWCLPANLKCGKFKKPNLEDDCEKANRRMSILLSLCLQGITTSPVASEKRVHQDQYQRGRNRGLMIRFGARDEDN